MKKTILLVLTAVSVHLNAQTAADASKNISDFSFRLYQRLEKKQGENFCFSPFSISSAFAMTYAGTKGQTEAEFRTVFGFPENTPAFHNGFSALNTSLSKISDTLNKFNIANRIFPQKGMLLEKEFLSITSKQYNAPAEMLDYAGDHENCRKYINTWVEKQTQDRIKDLLPVGSLNDMTRMVLVNALYMKTKWKYSFELASTREMPFYGDNNQTLKAKMMYQRAELKQYRDTRIQTIELPYAGEKCAMYIVIPAEAQQPIDSIRNYFTKEIYEKMLSNSIPGEVDFFLPRFTAEYSISLKKILSEMGMPGSFNEGANFSSMSSGTSLSISDAYHKTFVEVNEEGTEAAAATAVVMQADSAMHEITPVFKVDRPFIYLLVDKTNGAILFFGEVHNPSN